MQGRKRWLLARSNGRGWFNIWTTANPNNASQPTTVPKEDFHETAFPRPGRSVFVCNQFPRAEQ